VVPRGARTGRGPETAGPGRPGEGDGKEGAAEVIHLLHRVFHPADGTATDILSQIRDTCSVSKPERPSVRQTPHVPAATRALTVLRLLAQAPGPVPAAALARELELPRSSVYHLLTAMAAEGFVTHLPEDHLYGLGVAAFEIGSAYSRQEPLQRLARPVLSLLVDTIGQSAHLAVLHGNEVLYLVEERAPGRPPLVTDVGVRLPAHLAASGRALLAALPAAQVLALFPDRAAFVERHGGGPTSLSQLRRLLTQVRRDGVALEDDAITPGFSSLAAVVRNHTGYPAAAVAVTFESDRLPVAGRGPLTTAVLRAAAALERRLHGRAG
jgi:DNA-binding IclR family transcriptional regulator